MTEFPERVETECPTLSLMWFEKEDFQNSEFRVRVFGFTTRVRSWFNQLLVSYPGLLVLEGLKIAIAP